MNIYILAAIVIVMIIAVVLIVRSVKKRRIPPHKAAGNAGEEAAAAVIKRLLREDDLCFRNVKVSYDGQDTELDFMVVNPNGVFIIEVKNYSGQLFGSEDDREWEKHKTSQGGNLYKKTIENPIVQVKREEHILGNCLRSYGSRVWVKGYVFFLRSNSPIKSRYTLNNGLEIDRALHEKTDKPLTQKTIDQIIELLHV